MHQAGPTHLNSPEGFTSPLVGTDVEADEGVDPLAQRRAFVLVDSLRGVSALIIMTHHLSRYGPQSDHAMELFPGLIDGFWVYGALPVQVFLVICGFAAAISMQRARLDLVGFGRSALRRYLRLGAPYLSTIMYGLILYRLLPLRSVAFPLFDAISWKGMLAHAFFLQDIFGYPSLYAGFWYLAVDYQFSLLFFALMLIHAWLIRMLNVQKKSMELLFLLILFMPVAIMSIFYWNLNSEYSIYAPYFFGSLFLGVVCGWSLVGRVPDRVFWAYVAIVLFGLVLHWRIRLFVSLLTGTAIFLVGRYGSRIIWRIHPIPHWLGRISYSLFLVHYPTSWAVLSVGALVSGDSPGAAVFWMMLSVALSLVVATAMYYLVELPALRLANRLH